MLFRLSEIEKSFGGTEILRGLTFQVNPGEKIGLVGRNGAGKTTIFRLITGVDTPDSGDVVTINGLKLGVLQQHVDFEPGETVHTAALSAFKEIHDIEAEMRLLGYDDHEVRVASNACGNRVRELFSQLRTGLAGATESKQ